LIIQLNLLQYKLFEEAFISLPVATLVTAPKPPKPRSDALPRTQHYTLGPSGTKRYFVVHGGLFSDDNVGLEEVRKIDRIKQQQPTSGTIFGEALWTDPQDQPGRGPSKRGVGLGFGPDVTKRWTEANKVTAVIRSHEVSSFVW
jgi:serine/threonine-protein phosphatase 5